jgi:23S rRNA U2552 (ribose-2'-O)-methylase RlmE/FtsJ
MNNTTLYWKKIDEPYILDKSKSSSVMARIDTIPNNIWHYHRKLLNFYDFNSREFCINRAFYKLWEIIHDNFTFVDSFNNSLHLAEAPGSFVQVVSRLKPHCKMMAISKDPDSYSDVLKYSKSIPQFSPFLIRKITNCDFQYMDILNKNILKSFSDRNIKYDFITADGGIDDNGDYEHKEELHYNLIICEIIWILLNLQEKGNCVLKVFDIFTKTTTSILYFLNIHFDSIDIIKPITSRPTNSEKYIICKNFKGLLYTRKEYFDLLDIDSFALHVLNINIPDTFIDFVKIKSRFFIDSQINAINFIVDSINTENRVLNKKKIYDTKDRLFLEWCKNYNLSPVLSKRQFLQKLN